MNMPVCAGLEMEDADVKEIESEDMGKCRPEQS